MEEIRMSVCIGYSTLKRRFCRGIMVYAWGIQTKYKGRVCMTWYDQQQQQVTLYFLVLNNFEQPIYESKGILRATIYFGLFTFRNGETKTIKPISSNAIKKRQWQHFS